MIARPDPRDHAAAVLVDRLNTGWTVCAEEPDPVRKTRLEDHWIALLRRYEMSCDRVGPGPEQKPDARFSPHTED